MGQEQGPRPWGRASGAWWTDQPQMGGRALIKGYRFPQFQMWGVRTGGETALWGLFMKYKVAGIWENEG